MSAKYLLIGVVGAGVMGRGIVQLFAQTGHCVKACDSVPGAAQKAVDHVNALIAANVEKGRVSVQQAEAIKSRMSVAANLQELADCDMVIEAIAEDIDAKRHLFVELEKQVAPNTILATNTSSLMVTEIAAHCEQPGRVAGLHFFNPVPLMKVVEVIPGLRTEASTTDRLRVLVEGTGHRAVVAADQPGFLVNHAGRGLYTEGLRIIEEQVATPAEVDTLMREAAGFRMGPFELMDLTGLDVSGKVMESIYEQFQHEPRFRPSSLVRPRIAAQLYGRKTGAGWYRYDGDKRIVPPPRPAPLLPPKRKVWIDPDADQREALSLLTEASGARRAASPDEDSLLIIQPWGNDATTYCTERGLDATRCVAVDPLTDFSKRRTVMLTAVTRSDIRDSAQSLLSGDGIACTIINDSPGFIVQRVLATIINIATNIAQRGIASVSDIEDAVKLGLGYPEGPLSMGDRIGGKRVMTILRNMHAITGDPRYRPSLWLARRAALGVSLLTQEAER